MRLIPFFLVGALGFMGGFFAKERWHDYKMHRMATDDEATMEALSRIIVLPEEIPSIATVTDKEKLDEQPFFQSAENGDKVIIYPQSKRAYLFRPREQKIIDMTVVAIATPTVDSLPVFQTNGQ